MFVDDVFCYGEVKYSEWEVIFPKVFDNFHNAFGLIINKEKSEVISDDGILR